MGCGSSTTSGATPKKKPPARTSGNSDVQRQYRTSQTGNSDNQRQHRGGGGGGGTKGRNRQNRQPVNEKGYKKRIRENLREATAHGDIEELEKAMEIFVNNKLEDGGDYSDAQERMDFLLMRKDIRDACMRRHPVVLEKAIQRVENSKYRQQLKQYLERAKFLQQHQNELDTFRHDISDLDQTTVSEIRSYHHPPPGVHETMISVYMILGYPESHLTDWSEVTALMGRYGKDSLLREVSQADTRKVDNETARRAQSYLGQYSLEEVRSVSNGAAAFHVWASRMVGKPDGKKGPNSAPKKLTNSGKNQPTKGGNQQSANQSVGKGSNQAKTPNTPSKTNKPKTQTKTNNTATTKKG